MKVSTAHPFCVVYSLYQHEYLGYLWGAFAVQLDEKGGLSLLHQNISGKNVQEFSEALDADDFALIKAIDATQPEVILKKFNPKKNAHPADFLLKIFDPQRTDKALKDNIINYLDKIRSEIYPHLRYKKLFVMSNDGDPTRSPIVLPEHPATVRFHVMRNAENTHYFPTIQHNGQRVVFQYQNAILLCEDPAWMLLGNTLYHFSPKIDGKKLKPFFNKKFILIPKNIEEDYYRKFITPLLTLFDVYAKGFEILNLKHKPEAVLSLQTQEFNKVAQTEIADTAERDEMALSLCFKYGEHTFSFDSFAAEANVSMEKNGDDFVFHKIQRDITFEKSTIAFLENQGLGIANGSAVMHKNKAFDWLHSHRTALRERGIIITQTNQQSKRYFLGYAAIRVSVRENRDWFDLYASVRFGEFEIPFLQLKQLILSKKREFTLPNGETAVIPETWFTQYGELLAYAKTDGDADHLTLQKHHVSLIQELEQESLVEAIMSRKLERLRAFEEIEDYPVPLTLKGQLRSYQKAGYDWLRFLNQYHLGGCLADDMGLGKTLQTLALIASQYEEEHHPATLVVMPTSLIFNWQLEIQKFAPHLRVHTYTGTYRDKNIEIFTDFDVVLTTYGTVRMDVDQLSKYKFHYIILDESQSIKNPSSHVTKAVLQLQSRNRLILSGTPLENSTMDLWSQMTFLNPGLLGTQNFFRNEYQLPIEKKGDEKKLQRLFNLIKPFVMRRHKSQVAKELPEKIESVQYCVMTDAQAKVYEEEKSHYRNLILEHIENEGMARSQMIVLQGLTRLRQLANHPAMVNLGYEDESGKMEEIISKIETAVSEGHKILVFSQFVKHLELVKPALNTLGVRFAYLDGGTTNRQAVVEQFQQDTEIPVFLISLKAGGLGLNLTVADYVFILDPWWNPAAELQAIDRAHRIGQEKTVFTYRFISKDTVEEKIMAMQEAKRKLAQDLITTEDGFIKNLSKEDILQLLA